MGQAAISHSSMTSAVVKTGAVLLSLILNYRHGHPSGGTDKSLRTAKEDMPHGSFGRCAVTRVLTAFALKGQTTSVYLDICDSPSGQKCHTYPSSHILSIYLLFLVSFISVNNRSPLRKQDDIMEMGRSESEDLSSNNHLLSTYQVPGTLVNAFTHV